VNDDDGLPNLICAKCKRRVETLESAMMDLTQFKKEVTSCVATFLAQRRACKRIKDTSSDCGVSPDTAKARPPSKKMSHRRLDFGPSTTNDECRCSYMYANVNTVAYQVHHFANCKYATKLLRWFVEWYTLGKHQRKQDVTS